MKTKQKEKSFRYPGKALLDKAVHKGRGRGGARPNSGRRPKENKELWGKITCILKKETIARLQTEGGIYFGEYLQHHLERYPLPSRAEYQAIVGRQPLIEQIGRRKMPVIISAGGTSTPKVPRGHRWPPNVDPKKLEAAVAAALE